VIDDRWVCIECTLSNSKNAVACAACNATRLDLLKAWSDPEVRPSQPKCKKDTNSESRIAKEVVDAKMTGLIAVGKYELWPHGVLIFRNAVDLTLQHELLQDVLAKLVLRTDMAAVMDGENRPPSLGFSFQTGWVGPDGKSTVKNNNDAPVCLALASNLYTQARKEDINDLIDSYNAAQTCLPLKFPDAFTANSLWARAYQADQKLAFHQDPSDCHFAFIISLGRSVDFSYSRGAPAGKSAPIAYPTPADVSDCKLEQGLVHTITLHSGDAIFFNGTVLFHSITKIHGPTTLPEWWNVKDFQRIGLQMRQRTTT
jgi:alkylated DNA repair dioxygenase AlkB